MSYFTTLPLLGQLDLIEVYEYYDQPVLYSCKNEKGQIFIAVCSDEEEEYEIWLYAKVSLKRFELIRTGKISLFETFAKPESDLLYRVVAPFRGDTSTSVVRAESISNEQLPRPGEYLNDYAISNSFYEKYIRYTSNDNY